MTWSGPKEDMLRQLAGEGLSAAQISIRIGKSREAVCGKAWRLGIVLQGKPASGGFPAVRLRRKRAAARKKKSKPFMLFNQMGLIDSKAAKPLRVDGFVPPVDPPAPKHQRQTVATLEEHHCRWPIGHVGEPDFHFCGAEAVPSKPYCLEHCARAFITPTVRRPIREIVPAFQTEDA